MEEGHLLTMKQVFRRVLWVYQLSRDASIPSPLWCSQFWSTHLRLLDSTFDYPDGSYYDHTQLHSSTKVLRLLYSSPTKEQRFLLAAYHRNLLAACRSGLRRLSAAGVTCPWDSRANSHVSRFRGQSPGSWRILRGMFRDCVLG